MGHVLNTHAACRSSEDFAEICFPFFYLKAAQIIINVKLLIKNNDVVKSSDIDCLMVGPIYGFYP